MTQPVNLSARGGVQVTPMEIDPPEVTASAEEEIIAPKVVSVLPAIFIPADRDYTEPFERPENGVESVKRILESLESHRAGVHQSLDHLREMEFKRIQAEVKRWEATHGEPTAEKTEQRALDPAEIEDTLMKMAAPPMPAWNYNIAEGRMIPDFTAQFDTPDRVDAVRQMRRVMEDSLSNRQGYDHFMDLAAKKYTVKLKAEEMVLAVEQRKDGQDVEMG